MLCVLFNTNQNDKDKSINGILIEYNENAVGFIY